MDKLLAWSVAQQSGDKEAIEKIGKPDEKVLSQLFGGPDEPTLMKQSIDIVNDPTVELKDKEIALENFEMLIENLDNANNIENMKLWSSIVKLLDGETPDSLRILAVSIISIAVQNNDKAQDDFLKYDGFERLLAIYPDASFTLKLKVLFAISSLIRNNLNSFKFFNKLNGWEILKAPEDVDSKQKDKLNIRLLSVISSIISNTKEFKPEIEPKLNEFKVISFIIDNLSSNINCSEKSLQNLNQLINLNYKFDDDELSQLTSSIKQIQHLKEDYPTEFKAIESITK
ncbi:hsp70 nucleotide exchange factor Fes1p [[Candida] jaroonii]|uniref:Hsp70 nucleotide exchange factor Fes1p n=1 Tax=[Candida] jaroonii TaxID=467808 RepID=A0ACA9YG80_9ASCO|nr:hsp70 nucleotide exchange factor Fes1p [[Candida] jaroonii]